jgi:tetratricopeptide (TPR) repeat protein
MSIQIEKAQLLIGQQRYELALKELQQELFSDPDNPYIYALQAMCLRQLNLYKDALEAAQRAVQIGPDFAFAHYVLSGVYDKDDRLKEAELAILEAIRLDPEDADYYARLSSIQFQQRRWEDALRTAEQALELEPTNSDGLNLRSMALSNLNRLDEASAATEGALASNPEDAMAHASKGWQHLRAGNTNSAMTHFKEALRLDSSQEWARQGVVEALKARNPVYRVMLAYFLWTSRLEPKAFWGFIIGGYVASRVLSEFAKANPQWGPYIWPVLGLYFAFVLMTWIAVPLFNLLLRTNPLGRILLTRQQVAAANWFGGALLLALVSLASWLIFRVEALLLLAIVAGLMVIPISSSLGIEPGRRRTILVSYTWLLAACGTLLIGTSLVNGVGLPVAIPFGIFFLGVATFTWVATVVKNRV